MEAIVKYKDENNVDVSVHLADIKRAEFRNGVGTVEDVNGAKIVANISGDVTMVLAPDVEKEG